MDTFNEYALSAQTVLTSPAGLFFIIAVILIIVLYIFLKKDSFDGMVQGEKSYAEFPASFVDAIVPGFIKDVVYDNYFTKSSENIVPYGLPISQLELPTHSVTVPIDIGNGMAVNAKVQVPAQTVELTSQVPVSVPEPQKTDVLVSAQQVQIPAQTGIIPGKVEGSSQVLTVPVEIPAQVVNIPEQNAVIPTMEPFRM
jgi:hypothetical protein